MQPKWVLFVILLELCVSDFSSSLGITFDKVDRSIAQPQELRQENEERQTTGHVQHDARKDAKEQQISDPKYKLINEVSNNSLQLLSLSQAPLLNTSDVSSLATREKRQGESRSSRTINFDAVGPGVGSPLCFEREVSGTCRYRTAPDECFRHEWTAHATIVNIGYKKITSIPEGLIVFPGGHPRVRVFLKSSCCNPIVEFIATDLFLQSNVCLVDVRELQDLHPGEIVGIVLGILLFFIILIVVIALCLRRQRRKKLEKETVIFGRSLTRSKSRSDVPNHR